MTETPVSAPQLHPRRAVPRTGDCYAMLCYAGVARSSVRITQSVSHKRASSYGYKMELKNNRGAFSSSGKGPPPRPPI